MIPTFVENWHHMGYESPFFKSLCRHYELASFLVDDEDNTQYHLHVGEVVSIISEEAGESFAILRSIFNHERDNQRFAFIVIDRFEITNQTRLECPVYRLQDTKTIRPISEVNTRSTVHFIHCC